MPGYYIGFMATTYTKREFLHQDQLPTPSRNWTELQSHKYAEEFRAAALKEYQDLERRGTFQSVQKTPEIKTLPLKWVFTYKLDTNGDLQKFKARLCVRGDL